MRRYSFDRISVLVVAHRRCLLQIELLLLLLSSIHYYNNVREKSNLLRQAILLPSASPWQHLWEKGDQQSFLLMTGVTREVFSMMLNILYSPYDRQQYLVKKGRPNSLLPHAELGLFLFFIGSTMNIRHLSLIFGAIPSVCSKVIRRLLTSVPRKLMSHEFAKVEFPNNEQMAEFAAMIQAREPIAIDVIGFMDGVALHSQCTSETGEQNSMYNGYHSDTMVNNVIVYGANGKVILCAINFPGSTHDGSICANILPIIRERIGVYKICVDQGFPRRGDALNILVGPMSKRSARALSPLLRRYVLRLSNAYVSPRQASEWGMRCLQGSFPRIKRRLPSCKKKRRRVLESIILIHNFRTHLIGRNQITAVFDPEYENIINIEGYDRIARYYNSYYE